MLILPMMMDEASVYECDSRSVVLCGRMSLSVGAATLCGGSAPPGTSSVDMCGWFRGAPEMMFLSDESAIQGAGWAAGCVWQKGGQTRPSPWP